MVSRVPEYLSFGSLLLFSLIAFANDPVVAVIGKKSITKSEFDKRYQQNASLTPERSLSKKEVLDNIIDFELAVQEADRLDLEKDEVLQNKINILLYQELVKRQIQPKIDALRISEDAVRRYYRLNPLIRTRHIVLLIKPGMTQEEREDVRKKARRVLGLVREGKKSFEELAKEYSEGPSAKTGGDVDWGARHKLIAEYYDAALALKKPGKISDVVETPYGFHVIKLTGIREYNNIDEIYKNFVIRTLKEKEGKGIYDQYFQDLRKNRRVSVNEAVL